MIEGLSGGQMLLGLFIGLAVLFFLVLKTKVHSFVALIIATVIMCVMNLIVTPHYMGAPVSAVVAMIPTVIIPFNLLKAGINSLITFLVYKRISGLLHREAQ